MLKRVRHWKISLAAKCQLLFGAAVVLIIGAALFVPWQRMEQLTNQLNERSARTLIEYAVDAHVAAAGGAQGNDDWRTAMLSTEGPDAHDGATAAAAASTSTAPASTRPAVRVTPPTTAPIADGDDAMTSPRLILFAKGMDESRMTRFERRAIRKLTDRKDQDPVHEDYDAGGGRKGFRYARTESSCANCHAADEKPALTPRLASMAAPDAPAGDAARPTAARPDAARPDVPRPATAPATSPAVAHAALLGIVAVDIPSQIETSQRLLNRVFILTAGLLAGTLAIIVFYLITTRLILQPVRVLQETAQKVSEGDLNIRSDISTGDEFQQLSETFNTMLANLKVSADQLRAVNKSLDVRLGQLAESNVALYEANRLKSEFLANVSHELRTPLNSILGFADLLKDSSVLAADPKSLRYIQNIYGSGKNLLDLINDLLDLAKIEAGRMEIRSEPLSLGDLFEGLASVLKPLTEQKSLAIAPRVAADVPIIYTDPAKLQQVLYNFLSNAIKFSPPGGQIELRAERELPDGVRISVADRGPGIAPEKHDVIFEKFRQVDASVTRQHSGTGLGLAISKELITLLGGSIGVDSEPGTGATFWIVLPLRNEAGTQDVRERLVLS